MPGQRSQPKRFIVWATFAALLVGSACGRDADGPAPSSSAGFQPLEPLGSRAEVVASADALAVQAGKSSGSEQLRTLERAAGLRARLFRREHREADALEAIELFRLLARTSPARHCSAEVERVLIEAELHADPAATYRALYNQSFDADPDCRGRIDSALSMLEGFRPSDSVLAELEKKHAAEGAASASGGLKSPAPNGSGASVDSGTTMPSGAVAAADLTHIERYSAKDAARVVVFVSKPVRFEVGTLAATGPTGPRLFVDLKGARYSGKGNYPAGGLLERVRASEGKEGARVVLDLKETAEHRVFYVPEPFRLVIDVAKHDAALRPTRDVRRVVLDPGHGGHDPGAIGPTGLREKDVALDIAHRAAPLIARELGISTLLTRDTDVFVPLEERTARANGFGADLFISIHCNATERSGGSGVMTFVLDDSKDQLAARIAALENAASAEATSELARVMSRSGDRDSDARSNDFAGLLQRAAMASLRPSYPDVPDGGVKRAGFYVLAGARMPAVLFETSFISSVRDETRFNTGDFRQKLADAIVNAVRAYKEGRGRSSPQ